MKPSGLLLSLLVGGVLALLALVEAGTAQPIGPAPVKAGPGNATGGLPHQQATKVQQNGNKGKSIPLDCVHSTIKQAGLQHVAALFKSGPNGKDIPLYPYSKNLREIKDQLLNMGASNLFLVRGDDITEAIGSTSQVFGAAVPVDSPVAPGTKNNCDKLWLAAYLGQGHGGPKWLLQSVVVDEQVIAFAYATPKYAATPDDVRPFLYWVPLPELRPGLYELRLIDESLNRPTLSRWVSVP